MQVRDGGGLQEGGKMWFDIGYWLYFKSSGEGIANELDVGNEKEYLSTTLR